MTSGAGQASSGIVLLGLIALALGACSEGGRSQDADSGSDSGADSVDDPVDAFFDASSDPDSDLSGDAAVEIGVDASESPYRSSAEAAARSIDAHWVEARLGALADDAMEGRDNLTPGGERARDYLIAELAAMGLAPAGSDGWLQPFEGGVNVIGRIPGRDASVVGEHVIISAHYDHLGVVGAPGSQCDLGADASDVICNGAADNAAGVSAVLAVSRALVESELGTRRSILVAFWDAEEDGLLGSTYFVDEAPRVPIADVVAMFSIDNVGTEIVPGFDGTFAMGAEYSDVLGDLVAENSESADVPTWAVSSFFVGDDSGGRSDHLPFRLAHVPSIFFGSGATDVYHTPADEVGAVNVDKLTRIARHVLLVTADVANRDERVRFEAEPGPRLEDAEAILAVAERILEDPEAAGVEPGQVVFIESVADRLRGYLADPPETEAEWRAYQNYIEWVIDLVYQSL